MRKITFFSLLFLSLLFSSKASAQGCVAVRAMCNGAENTGVLSAQQWQLGANYRFFRSFRHFRGDTEESIRIEQGTEVINRAHSMDIGLSYALNERLSFSANLPLVYYDRSSLYEHYGNSLSANPQQLRFHTQAYGIGDLRLGAAYWLLPSARFPKGNVSIGLGIKLPSGNPGVEDDFHKLGASGQDTLVHKPVDQSIQPGDGGFGISAEIQAYRVLTHRSSVYANGFYLCNPRNTNNTLTRGTLVGADPLIAYFSVADQFAARIGVNYLLMPKNGLTLSLGARTEGVPSQDLLGKSDGFRRPGYIVSAEPGLSAAWGQTSFFCAVPIALYRNRTKSTYDLADATGQRHGDAAFADYLINIGVQWRFGGTQAPQSMPEVPQWKKVQ